MDDIGSCKEAAKDLNKLFDHVLNSDSWPKGCYAHGYYVSFNLHPIGSRKIDTQQICKTTGKC